MPQSVPTAAVVGRNVFFALTGATVSLMIYAYWHWNLTTYLSICATFLASMYFLLVWRSSLPGLSEAARRARLERENSVESAQKAVKCGRRGFFLFASIALGVGLCVQITLYIYLVICLLIALSLYCLLVWRSSIERANQATVFE
ncbi:MAG TPA: hypothetical protein V6C76_01825 [Drouetiella sp.]